MLVLRNLIVLAAVGVVFQSPSVSQSVAVTIPVPALAFNTTASAEIVSIRRLQKCSATQYKYRVILRPSSYETKLIDSNELQFFSPKRVKILPTAR